MIHKAPKFSFEPKLIVAFRDKKHPYKHKFYVSIIWCGYVLFLKSGLYEAK